MLDLSDQLTELGTLQKGMSATLVEAPSNTPEACRLQEMGLTVGTSFKVVKVAPLGDPIELDLRGYRLCLRRKETAGFLVQVAD